MSANDATLSNAVAAARPPPQILLNAVELLTCFPLQLRYLELKFRLIGNGWNNGQIAKAELIACGAYNEATFTRRANALDSNSFVATPKRNESAMQNWKRKREICTLCNAEISTKNRARHMATMHGGETKAKAAHGRIKCAYCPKEISRTHMPKHIKRIHGEGIFVKQRECGICQRIVDESNLAKHIRSHDLDQADIATSVHSTILGDHTGDEQTPTRIRGILTMHEFDLYLLECWDLDIPDDFPDLRQMSPEAKIRKSRWQVYPDKTAGTAGQEKFNDPQFSVQRYRNGSALQPFTDQGSPAAHRALYDISRVNPPVLPPGSIRAPLLAATLEQVAYGVLVHPTGEDAGIFTKAILWALYYCFAGQYTTDNVMHIVYNVYNFEIPRPGDLPSLPERRLNMLPGEAGTHRWNQGGRDRV